MSTQPAPKTNGITLQQFMSYIYEWLTGRSDFKALCQSLAFDFDELFPLLERLGYVNKMGYKTPETTRDSIVSVLTLYLLLRLINYLRTERRQQKGASQPPPAGATS